MAFCTCIKKFVPDVCPLEKGECMWQHRETKKCCFTEKSLTAEEYCILVGQEKPTAETLIAQREKLISFLQNSSSEDVYK